MSKSQKTVLSIYPNQVGFGYAYLDGPTNLIDYGVVGVSPVCNRKLLRRIKKSINYLKPTLILLRDHKTKQSPRVKRLVKQVIKYCKSNDLEVYQYNRNDIRNVFDQFKAKTKYEIAKTMVKWMPELKPKMPYVRKLWMTESHNMGIFDALSLAMTHYYLAE